MPLELADIFNVGRHCKVLLGQHIVILKGTQWLPIKRKRKFSTAECKKKFLIDRYMSFVNVFQFVIIYLCETHYFYLYVYIKFISSCKRKTFIGALFCDFWFRKICHAFQTC